MHVEWCYAQAVGVVVALPLAPVVPRVAAAAADLAAAAAVAPMADAGLYSIRPAFKEKFPPAEVKKIIGTFLAEFLADKS